MTTVIQSPVIETVTSQQMTLAEFFASPESDRNYEFIDGQVIRKMSPKRFHASLQAELLIFLRTLFQGKGFVYPEWGIVLTRNDQDWCPVPDLTYISIERLPSDVGNEMCPVPTELVIEIMSEGQTFKEFVAKAGDYLKAGILRVWVIEPMSRTFTLFYPDRPPENYQGDRTQNAPQSSAIVDLDESLPPDIVIEIADTSLGYDLGAKRLLYEEVRVGEYWVIDVQNIKITAFRILQGLGSERITESSVLGGLRLSLLEEALQRSREIDNSQVGSWFMQQLG